MPYKAFKITEGRGFHMRFANGFKISVQFSWGNYCDHYHAKIPDNPTAQTLDQFTRMLGAQGSDTAEVWGWDNNGKPYWEDPLGYQTANDVERLMFKLAHEKPRPNRED